MAKINLKKSVDFNKYVLNLFPEYKSNVVFKTAVPSGLLCASTSKDGKYVKVSSTEDIIKVIDSYCEIGHISYHKNTQYIFPGCTLHLEEISDGKMIMITIMNELYEGIGSHLWIDDEKDTPWWNSYIIKAVDHQRIKMDQFH